MAFFIRCPDTANSLKNITCIGLRGLSKILSGFKEKTRFISKAGFSKSDRI
jgi:hypothetical protein